MGKKRDKANEHIEILIEELVSDEMRYAIRLNVPLDVEYGFGLNWMEIK